MGQNIFGCDICQDVCPWNSKSNPIAREPGNLFAPPLVRMATLTDSEFRQMFHGSPVTRTKYRGFLRNVAVAMGNSGLQKFRAPLEKLSASEDELVAEHARWGLHRLSLWRRAFIGWMEMARRGGQ